MPPSSQGIRLLAVLVKVGAIVSTAGVALLVAFVAVLLAFPVIKECYDNDNSNDGNSSKCTYESTAPSGLRDMVSPGFLAASLLTIAAGIVMIRYSRWREPRVQT